MEGMPRSKALAAGDVARHSKQMFLFLHNGSRPIVNPMSDILLLISIYR